MWLTPSSTKPSSPSMRSDTLALRTSSMEKPSSNKRMKGPMAQEPLLSLALPSSSAERPSMSRRLTSLPSVAPTTRPALLTASTISGSGLFQAEAGCSPMSAPKPTADIGWDLENTSASGPIPTSMYWDQALRRCSSALSFIAPSEPGWISARSVPISSLIMPRTSAAFEASPPACSSITRSSRLTANVTPQALMA